MFSIFKGTWRGTSDTTGADITYIKIGVNFRDMIHLFRGANLHVFLAIALHMDENGLAYPSYETLMKETGYGRGTIARALNELCEIELEGRPVLIRWRKRDEKGQFTGSNHYLLFPTVDEVESTKAPTVEKSTVGETEPEEEPVVKEKPSLKEKKPAADAAGDDTSQRAKVIKLYGDNIGSITPIVGEELNDLIDDYGPEVVMDAIRWAVKTNARKLNAIVGCAKKMAGEKTPAEQRKAAAAKAEADASTAAYIAHAEKREAEQAAKRDKQGTEMGRILETAKNIVDNKLVQTHLEHANVAFIDSKAIFTIPETASLVWLNTKASKAVLQAVRFAGHKDISAVEFVAAGGRAEQEAA